MFFVINLIDNQIGNNIPHKYEGIKVNSLKTPVNIVSSSFKYKKQNNPMFNQAPIDIIIKYLFFTN